MRRSGHWLTGVTDTLRVGLEEGETPPKVRPCSGGKQTNESILFSAVLLQRPPKTSAQLVLGPSRRR